MRVDTSHSFGTFTEAHGTTATVWLSGDCDAAAAPRLHATLQPLVHNCMRWVRLDMEEVTFLDSVALAVILEARSQLAAGGRFDLVHPSVAVTRLAAASGLGQLLADTDGAASDRAEVERAIDALPELQRRVLCEYFGQRHPLDDVAATLHLAIHEAEELLVQAVDVLETGPP